MDRLLPTLTLKITGQRSFEPKRDAILTNHKQRASDNATISSVTYEVNGSGNRHTSSASVSPASSTTYIPNALNQYTASSGGAFQPSPAQPSPAQPSPAQPSPALPSPAQNTTTTVTVT